MESAKEIKKVEAVLRLNERNEEVIEICIAGNTYNLNFTKENQSYLRDFFKACIAELLKQEFQFVFKKDDSVKNEIIIKISEEYINDLNKELNSCLLEINKNVNN